MPSSSSRSSRSSRSTRPSRSRFSFYNLSTETLASMVWLDPAPIPISEPLLEEPENQTPSEECQSAKDDDGSDPQTPPAEGSQNLIYYLARVQRYSSYTFSIFTTIHLANTSLIPLLVRTVPASETYLLQARELYQTPLTEPLLVGLPIIAHVGSGIVLRFLRHARNLKRYGGKAPELGTGLRRHKANLWPPMNWISISGYAYTGFLAVHVFMNRILPLAVEGDSSYIGLGYVSHGFAKHPIMATMAYSGLIFVGCGHMVWGLAKWLAIAPTSRGLLGKQTSMLESAVQKRQRKTWRLLHFNAALMSVLWAGGMGIVARGGVTNGWVGDSYNRLFSWVECHIFRLV